MSEAESERDSAESEEEAGNTGRKRDSGRKTGLTDEATKIQNVKIMHVMLQSKKMLGSLIGFGRKDGTEFNKMSAAYEELHGCLQKYQDVHIKNLSVSVIRTRVRKCIKEVTAMVNDQDRGKIAKILHNGNVGSGELCDYDKCILEIARFYDKIKNVDI